MFEEEILFKIHNEIIINHGNKYDEYPEQFLSVKFIKPNDCVLEIGGNIGRNSCLIPDEWKVINTITWNDLKQKYNMNFNVLVADCEGALYYILKDEPKFLNGFQTILIENDFTDITHKEFVDAEFRRNNFKLVFELAGGFGPCFFNFYEAWQK